MSQIEIQQFIILIAWILTGVEGYNFVAQSTVEFHPNLYDYRNPTTTISPEPILYDYYPPNADDSSEEESGGQRNKVATNSNDYFVVGVENMLLHGNYKDDRHLVLLVVQGSDGLSPLDATTESGDDNHYLPDKYFPDAEFVFYSDDEPNNDDLSALNNKLNEMIRQRKC